MNCPTCGEELDIRVSKTPPEDGSFIDIDAECVNDHVYFARITVDDLMEG